MRALVWLLVSVSAYGAANARMEFRAEPLPGGSTLPAAKEYGWVNRVRFRAAANGGAIQVYREPVEPLDPQRETRARPKAIAGAPWIPEALPAHAGHAVLGWGDFDNDGSDELLVGWPAEIYKRSAAGEWLPMAAVPQVPRANRVLVADVDGDGFADVVAWARTRAVLVRNASWLPWRRHVIVSGFRTQSASAANFSGHGRMDVITGDIENDRKIVLYTAPDWKPTVLRSGIRMIQSQALDVNGDGRVDLIGSQYRPGLIFWLEQPQRPLADPWPFHVIDDFQQGGVDGVHSLVLDDLDGDGRPELLAASGWNDGNFPDSVAWFHIPANPLSAALWPRFILADRDAPGFNHYIGVGDVNGDGLPDVATAAKAGPAGNWFAWWEHPADPQRPWKKHLIAANQPGATNILIADLNGDGRPDFLASRGHGKGIVWFEAPDWKAHEIDPAIVGPHALAIADLDGDGDPDFAVCAKDSGILAWFENDGKGHFTQHRIHEDQSAYEIKLVDLNGDGVPDILVAGQESQNAVWYENRLRGK